MITQRRWFLPIVVALLPIVGLGGFAAYKQRGSALPEGQAVEITRITVEHVRVVSGQSFEKVTGAFEAQLGRFDPAVYQALGAGAEAEQVRARIGAMAGPSGFMLFRTSDHGALLRLTGQKGKAIQYLLGNPLFAVEMTRHDVRAGLYAPLRVLIYETDRGQTCVEYDRPSALLGQFGNANVTEVAAGLDRKLEQLVAGAVR
jgi:uncharacterized protein (DUF302 family)